MIFGEVEIEPRSVLDIALWMEGRTLFKGY